MKEGNNGVSKDYSRDRGKKSETVEVSKVAQIRLESWDMGPNKSISRICQQKSYSQSEVLFCQK